MAEQVRICANCRSTDVKVEGIDGRAALVCNVCGHIAHPFRAGPYVVGILAVAAVAVVVVALGLRSMAPEPPLPRTDLPTEAQQLEIRTLRDELAASIRTHDTAWRAAIVAASRTLVPRPDLGQCPIHDELGAASFILSGAGIDGLDIGPATGQVSVG